ncbi:hypothetical protein N0V90_005810 [Kalmusia sp. IMI 367209]|nr:hypothetical protein N0V90_005810 [Kalmusia sp. IMI 367209]
MPTDIWPHDPKGQTASLALTPELCGSFNINGTWTNDNGGSCTSKALNFADFITADVCHKAGGAFSGNVCTVVMTSDICTKQFGGTWSDNDGCKTSVNTYHGKAAGSMGISVNVRRSAEPSAPHWVAYLPEMLALILIGIACAFGIFKFAQAVQRRKVKSIAAAHQLGEKECQERYVDCVHHGVGA